MMTQMRASALAIALAAACAPAGLEDAIVTRGMYIDVHADPDMPVCSEAVANVDRYIEATAALLGVSPPHVTYYLYDQTVEGCRIAGEPADCTSGTEVYAATWPHYHELVHVVVDELGRPPAFLSEGIAEGLGDSYPVLSAEERAVAELPIESVRFYASDAIAHQSAAGDFAIYVLHRFGADAYRELFRRLLYHGDIGTTRRVFREITGEELDLVIADWRVGDPDEVTTMLPLETMRCAAPVTAAAGSEMLSCTSSYQRGLQRLAQPVYRSIEIAEPAMHAIAVRGDGSAHVTFESCEGPRRSLGTHWTSYSPDITTIDVIPIDQPGHYSASLSTAFPEPSAIAMDWSVSALGPAGTSCATAPVLALPEGRWKLDLRGHASPQLPRVPHAEYGTAILIAVRLTGNQRTDANVFTLDDMRLCIGPCDAPLRCERSNNHIGWNDIAGQPLYVELYVPADGTGHATISSE